jgi:predicted TPR repeat methyltransferase
MDSPVDDAAELDALRQAIADEPEVPYHHAALASALQARGCHDLAIVAHRDALTALDAQRAVLLYNLGTAYAAEGQLADAVATYQAALALRPQWLDALDNLGGVLQRQGHTADAQRAYLAALAIDPSRTAIRFTVGSLLLDSGDYPGALTHVRAGLAFEPDHADSLTLLAILLLRTGDASAACTAAEAACVRDPDSAGAHGSFGAALATLGRHAEARTAYDRARSLAPDRVEVHINCARGAEAVRDLTGAVAAYRAALAIAPDHAHALEHLIRLLTELDRPAEAVPWCAQLLAVDPNNPLTPHLFDALRGHATAAAPRSYVVAMFDDMAPRFEALLVGTLEYRVPELLRAAVDRVAPDRHFDHALDLGCGTGLTGRLLRPIVDVLHGVDLSPKMIDLAQAKGGYDELHRADLIDYLHASSTRYQLITATDVLIYIGDLDPLFAAMRGNLAGGGLIACSIERHDGVDVRLAPTGRYQHSRGYIERLATDYRLDVVAFDPIEARLESGRFVPAWLFILSAGGQRASGGGRSSRSRRRDE